MRNLIQRYKAEGGYSEVLRIAIPLILSTGAWSVQHFIDRMFLSWYSAEAIAAAMPAGILSFTAISLFMGTASYTSTFVAQYQGAGMYERIGPAIWQGIYISVIGGLVMVCLVPLAGPIFRLAGHEAVVQRYEVEYFEIMCLGGGPQIAASALSGFYAGRGKPWPVMWVNCAATALNLILDYALIFGKWGLPEMGVRGAAIATVLAMVFTFALYTVLIFTKAKNRVYKTVAGWRFDRDLFVRLMIFGVPSGMQFFLEIAGFTAFLFLVGRLGTASLAATNIAFNINVVAFMPMLGGGIAISVLVGQYLGKDRPELAQRSTYSGFHMAFAYMVVIAAGYVFLPGLFVAPFMAKAESGDFREIYRLCMVLLRFVAVYSIFDAMNIVFASAVKGAGDTRFVMLMMVVLSGALLVGPTYVAVVLLGYGLMTSWFFATTYVIVLGFVFYLRFLNGKWKNMRVIEREIAPQR